MSDLGLTIAETMTARRKGVARGVIQQTTKLVGATAVVAGRWCARGASDGLVIPPAAAGNVTENGVGIVLYDPMRVYTTATDQFDSGEVVQVCRKGIVAVEVEDAVTEGQTTFIRITADSGGPDGATRPTGGFRSDADSGEATECTRAVYRSSQSTVGGLALVEVNLP